MNLVFLNHHERQKRRVGSSSTIGTTKPFIYISLVKFGEFNLFSSPIVYAPNAKTPAPCWHRGVKAELK
jgi:hypothetical protein